MDDTDAETPANPRIRLTPRTPHPHSFLGSDLGADIVLAWSRHDAVRGSRDAVGPFTAKPICENE